MLRFQGDGEDRHRIEGGDGTPIGWVHGRTIGFRGLPSEAEAVDAAVAGARVLGAVLARSYPGWPRYEPGAEAVRLVHDGAYEWVSEGSVPLARLLRVRDDAGPDHSFALEFVLPSKASEGLAIAAAQVVGGTLLPRLRVDL